MITLGNVTAADTLKLTKAFARLEAKAQDQVLRPILTAASKVVAEAQRAEAPKESGLLAQALGASTTRSYRGGSTLFVAVGARRGFRRLVARTVRGKLRVQAKSRPARGEAGARNPTQYLHLVTRGRKTVSALRRQVLFDSFRQRFLGQSVAPAAPNPFVRRAWQRVAGRIQSLVASMGASLFQRLST